MSRTKSSFADKYEQFARERIAQLRKQKLLKASELSYSIDQSKNYISNIENGLAPPSLHTFFCIMECLDVTPAEFFSDDDNPQSTREMVSAFIALNEDDKQDMIRLVKKLGKK